MDNDKVFTSYFEKVRALQEDAEKKKKGRWDPYIQRVKKIGKYLLNFAVSVVCSIAGGWALSVVCSIAGGWALSTIWGWYVAPKFHLPQLGIVNAVGLLMIVNLLNVYSDISKQLEKKTIYQVSENKDLLKNGSAILAYLLTLFVAWVWHFFL